MTSKPLPPQRELQPLPTVPAEELVSGGFIEQSLVFCGFDISPGRADQLALFHNLMLQWNLSFNLTRISGIQDAIEKHYLDSLWVSRLIDLPSPLLDLGTGAGFPGIPLKIWDPSLQITLADGLHKKVRFLEAAQELLGFQDGLDVIWKNIDRSYTTPVRGVITRAVSAIPEILKRIRGCLVTGGQVIFMKGPNVDEEIATAVKRFKGEFELVLDKPYLLPGTLYDRRLVVFKRLKGGPVISDGGED
jgi:16S rRNA (guanine(527)-N(7))-methyltransferase RsmG